MFKLLVTFRMLMSLGFVEPMNEQNDDRELYIIYIDCDTVLEWIETGTFEYNEALTMNDLLTNTGDE